MGSKTEAPLVRIVASQMPEAKELFRFTPGGQFLLADGVELDEAARGFWAAVESITPVQSEMARLRAQAGRWSWLDNPRISDEQKVNWLAAVLEARREGWPDPEIVGQAHGSS